MKFVPQIRINHKSDMMPAIVSLIEGMNQAIAVQGVVGLICRTIVHGSKGSIICEFAILFLFKVLKPRSFKEKSHNNRSPWDFICYFDQVLSRLLKAAKDLVELGNHDGKFD